MGRKIAAHDRKVIPAEAKAIIEPGPTCHVDEAKRSATTVGIQDWKTIAPVMLAMSGVAWA